MRSSSSVGTPTSTAAPAASRTSRASLVARARPSSSSSSRTLMVEERAACSSRLAPAKASHDVSSFRLTSRSHCGLHLRDHYHWSGHGLSKEGRGLISDAESLRLVPLRVPTLRMVSVVGPEDGLGDAPLGRLPPGPQLAREVEAGPGVVGELGALALVHPLVGLPGALEAVLQKAPRG